MQYLKQKSDSYKPPITEVDFPDLVADGARNHRMSLKHPAKTWDEYLAELDEQGLIKTVVGLGELAAMQREQ